MNLKELINYVLFEESDPALVARRLDEKVSSQNKTQIETFFKTLTNTDIRHFPIGNGIFINLKNKKDLNNYIDNILNNIKSTGDSRKQIENSLYGFFTELIDKKV